jgi:hypothetical protein
MLVKVEQNNYETLAPDFNESLDRLTRRTSPERFHEFMVVWRKNRIELYTDWV